MKTLLVDRGFICGKSIGKIKTDFLTDVVVPLKAKMQITEDAWRLAELDGKPWQVWEPPPKVPLPDPPQRPEWLRRAEKKRQKTVAQKKKDRGGKPPPHLVGGELKADERMGLWEAGQVALGVRRIRGYIGDGEGLP